MTAGHRRGNLAINIVSGAALSLVTLFAVEGLSENPEQLAIPRTPRVERTYDPLERQNVCSADALNLVLSSDCRLTLLDVNAHKPSTLHVGEQLPTAQPV